MGSVYLFLANGFEEIEAISSIDILRRADINTVAVSISEDKRVVGAHNLAIEADILLDEVKIEDAIALVLPGGMPGASNLNECKPLLALMEEQFKADRLIAAICAAPMVLGTLGISKGRRMTCYPGFEDYLLGATITNEGVTQDGKIITGRGPAYSAAFALKLVEEIKGKAKADEVAEGMLIK